jgi:hypothetical protein
MMLLRSLPLAPALALFNGRADAQSSLGVQGFSGDLAYGITDDGRTTLVASQTWMLRSRVCTAFNWISVCLILVL